MVNEAYLWHGQLPDKEGQMYYMPADNYYMIPTSSAGYQYLQDEIIKEELLPVK